MNHVSLEMPTDTDHTVRAAAVYLATLGNERVRADPFVAETLRDLKVARPLHGPSGLDEPEVVYPQPPTAVLWSVPAPADGGPVWRQYGTCWRCADLDKPEEPEPLSTLWVGHGGRDVVELGFCDACRADLQRYEPVWKVVPCAAV